MNYKKIFSITINLAFVIFLIIFFKDNASDFKKIIGIPVYYIALMVVLVILNIYINGIKINLLTKFYNLDLKTKQHFGLSAITTMGNYIVPLRGGAYWRARYLKKYHDFSYMKFMSTFSSTMIITFFSSSLMGLIFTLLTYRTINPFSSKLGLIFFIALVLEILIMLFSPRLKLTKSKIINFGINVINEWRIIRKNYTLVTKLILADIVVILLIALRLVLTYYIIQSPIKWFPGVVIATITMLSILINITPGGLGIKETVIVLSTSLAGATQKAGTLVAILDRVISVIIVFSIGIAFAYILLKEGRKNVSKNTDINH